MVVSFAQSLVSKKHEQYYGETQTAVINIGMRHVTRMSTPTFTLNKFLPFSKKCKQSKSYRNLTFNS